MLSCATRVPGLGAQPEVVPAKVYLCHLKKGDMRLTGLEKRDWEHLVSLPLSSKTRGVPGNQKVGNSRPIKGNTFSHIVWLSGYYRKSLRPRTYQELKRGQVQRKETQMIMENGESVLQEETRRTCPVFLSKTQVEEASDHCLEK